MTDNTAMTATSARLALVLLLAAAAAPGCAAMASARLWADTAQADGAPSIQRHQWAYDGETVTFELECDDGPARFVVFGAQGRETVVNTAALPGRYRWARTFNAGAEPKTVEVYAAVYLQRGKCDWVLDRSQDTWYFYPGGAEKPDLVAAREQSMKITCYRTEIRMPFAGRGGVPKRIELTLLKATGERKAIPPRRRVEADDKGFLLIGPDAAGQFEVVYTPTHDEVSRAGTTRAELLVEHADGAADRLIKDIDTP